MNKMFNSTTCKIGTECGALYVIITRDKGCIVRVMADLGKSGTCAKAQLSAYCDFLSTCLSTNVAPNIIMLALRAASGHTCSMRKSCIDSLNRYVINVLENEDKEGSDEDE